MPDVIIKEKQKRPSDRKKEISELKTKRALLLVLSLLSVLSCAACGKKNEELPPTETTYIAEEKESGTVKEGNGTYTLYKTYAELTDYSGTEKEVSLPARVGGLPVLKIGKEAFIYNETLEKITLPEGLVVIGQSAFDKCRNLKTVVFPVSLEIVGDFSFRASGITSAVFADGLYSIGKYAFQDTPLTSVTVPDSCSFYGKYAFSGTKLTEAVIPVRVTSLGDRIYTNCDAMITAVIPRTVTDINDYAFSACDFLETIVIPPETVNIRDGLLSSSPKATVVTTAGSAAEKIAKKNGYPLKTVTEEELAAYYTASQDAAA